MELGVRCNQLYKWRDELSRKGDQADAVLLPNINAIRQQHRGHNGSFKTWRVVRKQGIDGGLAKETHEACLGSF